MVNGPDDVDLDWDAGRHRLTAEQYRTEMATRFAVWDQVTDLPAAA
jgi:hypothetical protein